MRFTKMHGIGNDYVYVNGFEESVADPAALAVRIADRHTGVGGDGLILVLPPEKGVDAHVRMRMFNADGSEAEMCGNGIRCVCKFAHDRGLAAANPMRIQTGNGVLTLRYTTDAAGKVDTVTVDMGEPILEPERIPVALNLAAVAPNPKDVTDRGLASHRTDRAIINHRTSNLFPWASHAKGIDTRMTCVSMGNPHVIFYCDDVNAIELDKIGPVIEHHTIFPKRINVHFVQVHARDQVTMRTWERGSGITLACGTGASAVCVAGVLTDRTDRTILAHLPGGDLTLTWRQDNHVDMTGPATEVFTGDYPV